jgi:hypothetical protein
MTCACGSTKIYAKGKCRQCYAHDRYWSNGRVRKRSPDGTRKNQWESIKADPKRHARLLKWKREKYHSDLDKSRAEQKAKYRKHAEKRRLYRKLQYRIKHPVVKRAPNGAGRASRNVNARIRSRKRKLDLGDKHYERPPAPEKLAVSDKNWWKLTPEERPRHWEIIN